MRPPSRRSSVVMIGRPASSTQARLHAARSSGVRSSSSAIEIRPRRVAEAVRAQVLLQSVAERRLAQDPLELTHDDRRLLIDDRAIERPGLAEVVERLTNRVRARRAVDVVGRGIVREQEAQLVIDLGERRIDDLRRHEVGEDLLHPHIVEPAHRDEIAEPHVSGFVRDEAGPSELLVLGRRRIEQQRRRVVEDGAGVFHTAELKRRHEEEVELAPGIRDRGVAFEPGNRRGMQVEDRLAIARDLGGVGLAVQHPERAARALGGFDREAARGKREEIRRERLGFGKRQVDRSRLPRVAPSRRRWRSPASRPAPRDPASSAPSGPADRRPGTSGARARARTACRGTPGCD